MSFGGYHPYPRRFGGGRPLLRIVHDSLNASRGSGVDASDSSTTAWVENMAFARAIVFHGYGVNARLALQWDPRHVTDMLSRWETIFRIVPAPTQTESERRGILTLRFRRFLEAAAFHSRLVSRLSDELGEIFGAVEYLSAANAKVHVPDSSYPWGTVLAGAPWESTVANILILLVKPAGYTESDFYDAAAKASIALDGLLPSWCTFSWYRAPANGVPISVIGGPSQAGFYLDNDHNLDNSVFDA